MQLWIAGLDADGHSTIISKGPPSTVVLNAGHDGGTKVAPSALLAPVKDGDALLAEQWTTPSGQLRGGSGGANAEWSTRWCLVRQGPNRVSQLHASASLNYDTVLEGPLDLLLEKTEARLKLHDSLVLPAGVMHGWRTGPDEALLSVVMVAPPS